MIIHCTFLLKLLLWKRIVVNSVMVHNFICGTPGHRTSDSGVQQGDPQGPLFFSLVLHKVIATIDMYAVVII